MFIKLMSVSIFIVTIVYYLFYLLSYNSMLEVESLTAYECGYDIMSGTRSLFSYRFFLLSILFLIFDVEIALMLPVPYFTSFLLSLGFCIFLFCLILGLLYEYYYGMLSWL